MSVRHRRSGKTVTDVRSAARSYTDLAINTLVGICKTGKQESAKAAAAQALLDRGWGKPNQHVSGEITHKHEQDLDAIIAQAGAITTADTIGETDGTA